MKERDLSFLEPKPKSHNIDSVRPPQAALVQASKIAGNNGKKKLQMSAAKVIRKFLMTRNVNALNAKGQTRFVAMLENMACIAAGKSPQAVAAYVALMDRAFGKARPHDDELEAIGKGGIQIVYVAPTELETVSGENLILPPAPDFIDAEFTETQ